MRKVKTRKTIRKEDIEDLIYYKLKNDRFKQQRLPAWRPVPTLCSIIIFYVSFALVFISLGIVALVYSSKIVSVEERYDLKCKGYDKCKVEPPINQDMKHPIMVYYKLEGFFQNHRRYVKSKSIEQLLGNSWQDKGECTPVITNKDMGFKENKLSISENEEDTLSNGEIAVPCGLIAKTYFNDSFKFFRENKEIQVNQNNIAFPKDKELYKNAKKEKQWIDIEDEHFLVWMRPAGLPNFRKLWGRIEQDLKKGDKIIIEVENNYDVEKNIFGKSIVLSTTNEFGGKNTFLGVSFIVVGIISLLLGIALPLLIYQKNKNENMRKNY
jgi:hypothetical protein